MINFRRFRLITAIVIALVVIGQWAIKDPIRQNPQNDPPPEESVASSSPATATGELTIFRGSPSIVDGDTVFIQGHKLRIWGIDAPDKDGPASDYYDLSTKYLRQYSAETWTCEHTGAFSFKRPIVQCVTDISLIDPALEMVIAGLAVDWPLFSNGLAQGNNAFSNEF